MPPIATSLAAPRAPFDACAESYDDAFTDSCIGLAQRQSVWQETDQLFKPGQHILEINCGTGVDALHMAQRGVRVTASDASHRMIRTARHRISSAGFEKSVDLHVLRIEQLRKIERCGFFDGALSNFSGLNCVEHLTETTSDLARLLKPGAKLAICVFGRWCAWEITWHLAHGNPRKAFRRLGRDGATARLDGELLRVYYPSVRDLVSAFAPSFQILRLKGVGLMVPPSYVEPMASRHPNALRIAVQLDRGISRVPLLRTFADHILLTFERAGD